MKAWIAGLALALGLTAAAQAGSVSTGHVAIELAPQTSAAPGRTVQVALHQQIAPGWHTYWRNPGDSGEPTRISWTLPTGWKAGAITWPAPRRLPLGPLMNYGYENEVLLPVAISVPATARPGTTVQLMGQVQMLVCKDVCIPEQGRIALTLAVTKAPVADARWSGPVGQALAAAPRPAGLTAAWSQSGGRLKIAVTGKAVTGAAVKDVYFFPYGETVIDHAAAQGVERGGQGLTLSLKPGSAFTTGPKPAEVAGVLAVGARAYEISARRGALPAGARGMGQIASIGGTGGGAADAPGAAAGGGAAAGRMGLAKALLFAFLGGAVLNLMPCVFPILSMKVLAVARHGENPAAARMEAGAFTLGVLATFVGLALVLVLAQTAAGQAGWGFQLQSPAVVAGLALLLLAIGLNLSGVFEAGLSLQAAGGVAARGGPVGAFLTGMLAVVVAAPCTAPFMAGAVGFALTQGAGVAVPVFAMLGLGFAAPFLILSLVPALANRLPRPGPWMDGLKKFLAFPIYGAAAWFAWILAVQAGTNALAALMASAVALALAAWLYGAGQRAQAQGRRALAAYGLSGLAALATVALALGATQASASTVQPESFSPQRVEAIRAEGRPVFVDFTAAWCITCQVNERGALSAGPVKSAFARTRAAYLRADWTRNDPVITQALQAQGRAGVPLYLVYGRSGAPEVLPQLLTEDTVVRALDRAATS